MYSRSLSNHLFCLALVLCLSLLTECVDDFRHRSLFDAGAGSAFIGFSVENVVLTRDGDGQDKESLIDHAYLLFYDADASLQSALPVAAVRAEVDAANPGNLQFKMPLRLTPNTDYQLLALANADSYVPTGFESFGDYLDSWCKTSQESRQELLLWHQDEIIASNVNCFPMHGKIPGNAKFSFSMENGVYHVSSSLSFRRTVARMDLTNNVGSGLVVEGVALCNWRDAVSFTALDSQLGNRAGTVRGVLSEEGESTDNSIFVEMPSAGDDGLQQLKKAIYCFPSVSYDAHQSDKESTALIIKAKYKDDSESSYYRVNVGTSGNKAEVKANTKYLVNIQSVKGSGAPSPKEAYMSSESLIVLSVVEDWDLDGGSFAMDENGNFIVLSSGRLEFDGDSTESKEIKILTSKGLTLEVAYEADSDASADAFTASLVSDSPISSLKVGPVDINDSNDAMSGKFVVSAHTPEGGIISVNLLVKQGGGEGGFVEPIIPDDMPFALVPESYDRVKIDHINRTIEIDGFDPSCFNSFIDIPFKVYTNAANEKEELLLFSTLQWPTEGAIAMKDFNDYCYCSNSFTSKLNVYSKSKATELSTAVALAGVSGTQLSPLTVEKDNVVHINVGSMAPDDPAIERTLTISNFYSSVEYSLAIKPRSVIIDDVIISDASGQLWGVCDRNVQNLNDEHIKNYMERKSNGSKYQAYNYLKQSYIITIPFKFTLKDTPFDESLHNLYQGGSIVFSERSKSAVSKKEWLQGYVYTDGQSRTSPFYESQNLDRWVFPNLDLMKTISQRICVSKLRMFLVSDFPVKSGRDFIPVCCYWPYSGDPMENFKISDVNVGYYADSGSGETDAMVYIYCDKYQMSINIPPVSSIKPAYEGFLRLVRPLTNTELEDYKTNYLGYGKDPHRLTICHPDTYESEPLGWIPY